MSISQPEHLGWHPLLGEFNLTPDISLEHVTGMDINHALTRMLLAAGVVALPNPWTHNPDKTSMTGVCPNCRRVALIDLEETMTLAGFQSVPDIPLLAVCWYAAMGRVKRKHKCQVDVCGCAGPHGGYRGKESEVVSS